MDVAATSELDQAGLARQWPIRQQSNPTREMQLAFLELKRSGILDEVDRQLQIVAYAASALIDNQSYLTAVKPDSVSPKVREIATFRQDRWRVLPEPRGGRWLPLAIAMGALLLALGLGWFGGSNLYWYFEGRDALSSRAAINAVVERIIDLESNGDPNAKNSRSSAMGPGQFLNETWLELVRTYRPDLVMGRSESKILELRRDRKLAREITTRFVERNASLLRRRGLPVTPGTIYLAHFAGGAGAVAILSAPQNADAALVMATADATGGTTREQIVRANPFLKRFTVADLKAWADRKMRGSGFRRTAAFVAQAER
jgi:hypothetical protein